MNKIFVFLPFCFITFYGLNAQTLKEQFNAYVTKKDTAGQRKTLMNWEAKDNNDPELFVAYYNYYIGRSKVEKTTDQKIILDQDTKQQIGNIGGEVYYNSDLLSKAFYWINKGIQKHPNRLDMRNGKVFIYEQIQDYEQYTTETIQIIQQSIKNKNSWLWTNNKPVENAKKFMLNSVLSYEEQIYNTENDSLFIYMKSIADTVIKYYPDHAESAENLSILKQHYTNKLKNLVKIENANPSDFKNLFALAQVYIGLNDRINAKRYLELVVEKGNEKYKTLASEQLNKLSL